MNLPVPVSFEWDKGNLDKNWNKHKVGYKEAEEVFTDEGLITYEDIKHSQKEVRLVALGKTNNGRKLYIVFTIRNKKVRIISARDQNLKERKLNEKK